MRRCAAGSACGWRAHEAGCVLLGVLERRLREEEGADLVNLLPRVVPLITPRCTVHRTAAIDGEVEAELLQLAHLTTTQRPRVLAHRVPATTPKSMPRNTRRALSSPPRQFCFATQGGHYKQMNSMGSFNKRILILILLVTQYVNVCVLGINNTQQLR